jgi:starch phosphorylase
MFPGYRIRAVTNGIHLQTWAHRGFSDLYDRHFPSWGLEPEVLQRADQIGDDEVWQAHAAAKADMIAFVAERTGRRFDPALPVIGYARRMTAYKRPEMLFSDIDRLCAIAKRQPFQIVVAGKAHPKDTPGKERIRWLHERFTQLGNQVPAVFVPNYDMTVAKHLVSGVDVWLNTPVPPLEASGTSGMKAALNGILNLSVLDGWWLEGCIEGVTGWAIGHNGGIDAPEADAGHLYDKLEHVVLPLYHGDRARWIWMMKQAVSKIACFFNTHRMMRRYAGDAYVI